MLIESIELSGVTGIEVLPPPPPPQEMRARDNRSTKTIFLGFNSVSLLIFVVFDAHLRLSRIPSANGCSPKRNDWTYSRKA